MSGLSPSEFPWSLETSLDARSHSDPLGDSAAGLADQVDCGCLTGSPDEATLGDGWASSSPPSAGPAAGYLEPLAALPPAGDPNLAGDPKPPGETAPTGDLKPGESDAAGDADPGAELDPAF